MPPGIAQIYEQIYNTRNMYTTYGETSRDYVASCFNIITCYLSIHGAEGTRYAESKNYLQKRGETPKWKTLFGSDIYPAVLQLDYTHN